LEIISWMAYFLPTASIIWRNNSDTSPNSLPSHAFVADKLL
jgi:hypothetical protein